MAIAVVATIRIRSDGKKFIYGNPCIVNLSALAAPAPTMIATCSGYHCFGNDKSMRVTAVPCHRLNDMSTLCYFDCYDQDAHRPGVSHAMLFSFVLKPFFHLTSYDSFIIFSYTLRRTRAQWTVHHNTTNGQRKVTLCLRKTPRQRRTQSKLPLVQWQLYKMTTNAFLRA